TVDNAGNRTAKSDLYAGVTTNYGYDNIYELLNATQGGSTTESYTYDSVGNRLTALGSATWRRVARTRNGKQNLGAPLSFSRGWVLGFSFLLSFRNDINCNQPRLTLRVERPTAPRPVLRMAHQSARHRVAVHVVQLLSFLPVRVHVEIVKARLPEATRVFARFRKCQPQLFLGCVSP